jgi:hypothetical protein
MMMMPAPRVRMSVLMGPSILRLHGPRVRQRYKYPRRMITARIRVGHPARVFRYDSDDEKRMRVQFARLCVLYDDLMREFAGANEEGPITALDGSGFNARRFYFVRRSLGTLSELRGAIAVLNGNTAFQARKAGWPDGAREGWDEAVRFFAANHEFLKDWRNDVGGHFHDKAAQFAIDNIEDDTVGAIEIYRRGTGADVRMKFAYDLVAVAMVKNRDHAAQTVEEFLKEAFTFLLEATKHSVNAAQIITTTELWDRFK